MTKKRRDKNGRFLPGNGGSPGRKPRNVERDYLKVMLGVVSIADWKQVIEVALAQALDGDHRARQWLSDYLVGKPPQVLDVRGADALMLHQIIELSAQRGISASDLFNAMLSEIAQVDAEADDD